MNVYIQLNKAIRYIEEKLFEEIDLKTLSQFLCVNISSFKTIFSILTGQTVTEYIKKRRLSEAIKLIEKDKIINVAILCGYDSRASFSRAFKKFHGYNPSEYKKGKSFKYFNSIYFNENCKDHPSILASYKSLPSLTLYGIKCECYNFQQIEKFWQEMKNKHKEIIEAEVSFGLVYYDKFTSKLIYYIALRDKFDFNETKITIPKTTYISTILKNPVASQISKIGNEINSKDLANFPDIEIYTSNQVELLYKVD